MFTSAPIIGVSMRADIHVGQLQDLMEQDAIDKAAHADAEGQTSRQQWAY
jgi:hypothetical protein